MYLHITAKMTVKTNKVKNSGFAIYLKTKGFYPKWIGSDLPSLSLQVLETAVTAIPGMF